MTSEGFVTVFMLIVMVLLLGVVGFLTKELGTLNIECPRLSFNPESVVASGLSLRFPIDFTYHGCPLIPGT